MTADQDQIHLTYQTDALGLSAEEKSCITGIRPSAFSHECLRFGASLELPVTFMLHPINLFVTKDASQDCLPWGSRYDGATQVGSG